MRKPSQSGEPVAGRRAARHAPRRRVNAGAVAAGGLLALVCQSGSAHALEEMALSASPSVWERFNLSNASLVPGQRVGMQVRGIAAPRMAPTLAPLVGLGLENAHIASEWRGSWVEAARLGPLSIGAVASNDRLLALTASGVRRGDSDNLSRFGGFMAFADGAAEIGRIELTTGRFGGFDLKATRSFKLNDRVSLDVGPTISLGSFERFGYAGAQRAVTGLSPDRAQLGAFGLTTAIEARLGERTVARMFADYARIEAQRSAGTAVPNRDRVDFGFSLSTTINP